ncbi:MAG TPA: quinone-dependent dihydroorotate dehydrogenase [Stellaceae bacterium]|nr:quinone-dependent dihydroorotate dehydrogenase [Stellaceae bacterium]
MFDLYPLIRPLLFRLSAEGAHGFALKALESGLWRWVARSVEPAPPELKQRLWGLDFANPVGLAAGFDKDARVPQAMLRLGFGFIEIGTVTPRPQPGNEKPRLFRLDKDRAVINRLGFNSGGLDAVIERLPARSRLPGIVGINLGKNRDSEDAARDYEEGLRRAAPLADFLVVNISSPNTPGLRDLQRRASLESLLGRLIAARTESGPRPPLLVKIAPDLTHAERIAIAEVALAAGIDGLVIANTTLARPAGLRSAAAGEAGGLSGQPLFAPSTALLAEMYRLTGGRLPLVGVGGVASAEDAYAKIRAGASLVELYTALVFEGPALIGRITRGLARLLRRDGFARIGEAVGVAATASPWTSHSS